MTAKAKKDEIFKVDEVSMTVKVRRKTPLHEGRNALYMHFGGGSFETDTHTGFVYVAPMGGAGPVITIRRKDEPITSKRHYAFDANEMLRPVLQAEGSKGDAREPKKVK